MTVALQRAALLKPPTFTPLSMAWSELFWAGGPAFTALGLADGAAVASWANEKSAHHAVQATAGLKPLYRASVAALNNRPAVDFDGADDLLLAVASRSAPWTIVMVVSHDDAGNDSALGYASGTNGSINFTSTTWRVGSATANVVSSTTPATAFLVAQATVAGTTATIEANGGGSGAVTGPGVTTAVAELRLGNRASALPFDGKIAFCGLYPFAMGAQPLAKLKRWAASHYGLTIA